MKNNTPKDSFFTQCWLYTTITDPYQVFAHLFGLGGIQHFRQTIRHLLLYAQKEKVYKTQCPADFLIDLRALRSGIRAANMLRKEKGIPLWLPDATRLPDKVLYCSRHQTANEWEELPQTLSVKDFCNPYRVFRSFFAYQPLQQWEQLLQEASDCALSPYGEGRDLNLLPAYLHLMSLIEAAYLVDVRRQPAQKPD